MHPRGRQRLLVGGEAWGLGGRQGRRRPQRAQGTQGADELGPRDRGRTVRRRNLQDREAWEEGGPREPETLEGGWGTEV